MTTTFQDLLDAEIQAEIERPYKEMIAQQAAVIEKLRDSLKEAACCIGLLPLRVGNSILVALSIPTDSQQILQEWLDEKLGDYVAIADGTFNHNCGLGEYLYTKQERL